MLNLISERRICFIPETTKQYGGYCRFDREVSIWDREVSHRSVNCVLRCGLFDDLFQIQLDKGTKILP